MWNKQTIDQSMKNKGSIKQRAISQPTAQRKKKTKNK